MRVEPLEPRRIRSPKGAYGWIDLRIVTGGYLEALGPTAALTYLFLCTVGNREGLSFWSRSRMARTLNLPLETVDAALQHLRSADLIAATERIVQVLPLPAPGTDPPISPPTDRPSSTASSSPAETQANTQVEVSEDEIHAQEPMARAAIARFYGAREPKQSVLRGLARSLALKAREIRP